MVQEEPTIALVVVLVDCQSDLPQVRNLKNVFVDLCHEFDDPVRMDKELGLASGCSVGDR